MAACVCRSKVAAWLRSHGAISADAAYFFLIAVGHFLAHGERLAVNAVDAFNICTQAACPAPIGDRRWCRRQPCKASQVSHEVSRLGVTCGGTPRLSLESLTLGLV